MVPPSSDRIARVPPYSRTSAAGFPYGAVTRSGPPFQALPVPKTRPLACSAFARHYLTESRLMSVPPATEMFQFAGFASPPYEFRRGYPLARVGCPIRRSRDHRSLASPPGFSQRATSFIASQCQGIHQMPFLRLILGDSKAQPTLPPSAKPPRTGAKPNPARHARPLMLHEDTSSDTTHASLAACARPCPPRSHDKLSLHPSINTPARVAPDAVDPQGRLLVQSSPNVVPNVVEVNGIEPMTSCLQSRRSPN